VSAEELCGKGRIKEEVNHKNKNQSARTRKMERICRQMVAKRAAFHDVGAEALSRKATCLLFIHLESDAHKVNPCVRHRACTAHNTILCLQEIDKCTRYDKEIMKEEKDTS
jgi:hypothetical protein